MPATIVPSGAVVWGFGPAFFSWDDRAVGEAMLLTGVEWQSKPGDALAEIEDMDGAAKALVLLDGDYVVKVKGIYDESLTYPEVGDNVLFIKPEVFDPELTPYQKYDQCVLVSPIRPSFTQKKVTEITFTLKHDHAYMTEDTTWEEAEP